MVVLRALNPQTEQSLFRQAFDWRNKPRKNRMSFDDFAKDDPSQIALGLFSGELQAVYFFHEIAPNVMQAHFTSSRKADRGLVLAGARTLVQWFQENGIEMVAYIHKRNKPLLGFVEQAGLRQIGRDGSICALTSNFDDYAFDTPKCKMVHDRPDFVVN